MGKIVISSKEDFISKVKDLDLFDESLMERIGNIPEGLPNGIRFIYKFDDDTPKLGAYDMTQFKWLVSGELELEKSLEGIEKIITDEK